jgi:hypothetical protein
LAHPDQRDDLQVYTRNGAQSGKCLDDKGWSTTPGTQLQIWDCTGHANQQWSLP